MDSTTIIVAIINAIGLAAFSFFAPKIYSCCCMNCPCCGSHEGQTNDVQRTENKPLLTSENSGVPTWETNDVQSTEDKPLVAGKNSGVHMNAGQSSRVYMVYAKDLDIEHINKAGCWILVRQSESRFDEVARLENVCWLEINATINFCKLLPKTDYDAFIIFRTTPESVGLNITQVASVSVSGEKPVQKNVCLKPTRDTPPNGSIEWPVERDGWMELELGQFHCDNVTGDKEAVISIKEIKYMNKEKKGLIVAGIELRPIEPSSM